MSKITDSALLIYHPRRTDSRASDEEGSHSVSDSDDDEVLGEPVFEMLIREGQPVIAGSYFMHPPLRQQTAEFDSAVPGRLVVTATNGSRWYADDIPPTGLATVRLHPLPQPGAPSE